MSLSNVHIFNFLVNKYKSSIIFRRFSQKKSLGLVLFSRDGRVTEKINIFLFAYHRHRHHQSCNHLVSFSLISRKIIAVIQPNWYPVLLKKIYEQLSTT